MTRCSMLSSMVREVQNCQCSSDRATWRLLVTGAQYHYGIMTTCWLINTPRSYFEIARERGLDLLGIDAPNARKSRQMSRDDEVVFYVSESRTFVATARVKSQVFEGHEEIWTHPTRPREQFRSRLRIEASLVASDPTEEVEGLQVGPTLEYVKRWPPEWWHLALFGMVHILSQRDFDLLETELKRSTNGRT